MQLRTIATCLALLSLGCSKSSEKEPAISAPESPTPAPESPPSTVAGTAPVPESPTPMPAAQTPPESAPTKVSVIVSSDGYIVAAANGDSQKLAMCNNEFDDSGLAVVLCELRKAEGFDPGSNLDMAADEAIRYQTLVSAISAAKTAGFQSNFTSHDSLQVKVPSEPASIKLATGHCNQPIVGCVAPSIDDIPASAPLKKAVIIVVTKTEILVNKTAIVGLKALAKDPASLDAGLAQALAANTKTVVGDKSLIDSDRKFLTSSVVLQADKSTSAKIIGQIAKAASKVGYDDMLFAVNMN